jgi:hypothetical protein
VLLQNSNLPIPTPGEMPAVGWLDGSTARVVDDANGLSKLVMDAKKVPKAFSQLVDVGAYRKRSSELEAHALGEISSVTSQVTGKTYDWVVTGLAWLGAKLPAVRTLDDVVKLYEDAGIEVPSGAARQEFRAFAAAEGTVVWAPDSSFQSMRDDVNEALNGPPTGGMNEPRFWVRDVNVAGDRALVQDYYSDGCDGWVIPFTRAVDGTVTVAPSSDWQPVEEGWVAAAKEYERKFSRAAEPRLMELTLTDEQAAALREKLAIDGDAELTPEALTAAAETRANELADAKAKADAAETRKNESDELGEKVRKLETDLKTEQTRRFESERDADIKEALRTRIEPADKEKWEKRYETLGVEQARELLFELPKREAIREFGSDDDGREDDADMKSFEAEIAREAGVAVEDLI